MRSAPPGADGGAVHDSKSRAPARFRMGLRELASAETVCLARNRLLRDGCRRSSVRGDKFTVKLVRAANPA